MGEVVTAARHSSASNEHYTPCEIVERATRVLGGIDLDPASCDAANANINATTFYDAEANGFTREWSGSVFLNPPGGSCDIDGVTLVKMPPAKGWFRPDGTRAKGQSSQRAWWFKLAHEHAMRRVRHAIFVCFSVELLQTTQNDDSGLATPLDFPICFPRTRVDYLKDRGDGWLKRGGAPPHASAIVYLPPTGVAAHFGAVVKFRSEFESIGRVVGT